MNRRDFLRKGGQGLVGGGLALGYAAALKEGMHPDPYQPVGYIDVGSPGAIDVDFVTLDGERVEHVFEANDVEGWLRHYGPIFEVDEEADRVRSFYRTGEVRVYWRKSA